MTVRLRPPALSEGRLETDPVAHLLLVAFEARFSGSLVLWSGEQPFGVNANQKRLLLEDGVTVAADMGPHSPGLLQALIPLILRREGGYRFLPDVDAVGSSSQVLRGHVDPFMLLASALRGPVREDAIEHVVRQAEGRQLKLRPGCPLDRFGLTRDEWMFLQELRRRPGTVQSLIARTQAPQLFTKRMIYMLRVTGALALLPLQRQVESRAISIPGPPMSLLPERPTAPPMDDTQQRALLAVTAGQATPTLVPVAPGQGDPAPTTSDDVDPIPESDVVPAPSMELDVGALMEPDDPFAGLSGTVMMPSKRSSDPRPEYSRVPSVPPTRLSRDMAFRYREIVRHYEMLQRRNLFEILGVAPNDEDAAIQDAYEVLEVQWRHEHLPPELDLLRPVVEAILEGITEARDTLLDPARRFAYIENLRHGEGRLPTLCRLEAAEEARIEAARETRRLRPRRVG